MAKTTAGQIDKKERELAQAFVDDIKAVEEKHGMRIIPMIEYASNGLFPTLGRQKVDKVELKADKKAKEAK